MSDQRLECSNCNMVLPNAYDQPRNAIAEFIHDHVLSSEMLDLAMDATNYNSNGLGDG